MPAQAGQRRVRAAGRLLATVQSDSGPLDVINRAASALLATVPADVWCGVLLDPSTLLDTGGQHESGFPEHLMPRLFEIEHAEQDDVDNLRALSRRQHPVSLLSDSTHGDLTTSKYYREILRPIGLADELRVLLRHGDRVWGLLVLCRATGSPPFTGADTAFAAELSVPATTALRRALLMSGVDDATVPDAPGLLMVGGDGTLLSSSPTAQMWLDELHEVRRPVRGSRPYVVEAIASRAATLAPGRIVTSRARTRSGGWVSLHAWQTQAAGQPVTAVALNALRPGELVAIILEAYALTRREREVTQQVLLGRSTTEIARTLHVSAHTVQDHLKSIFDKTGLRSRRDLVADLFFRHYLPQLASPSLSTDGRLLTP